jgi:hypothetical protein
MRSQKFARVSHFAGVILMVGVLTGVHSSAQVNVTTWHNDIGRTGQNTVETILTTSNVNKTTFGKVCSATVDGEVYAQPLSLSYANNSRNFVIVVTQNDSVYAIDGRNCSSLGSNTNLLPAGESPADCHYIGGMQCHTISPTVGILGTPVIDPATNTLYLVTESQSGTPPNLTWYHRIHALDLTLGPTFLQEKSQYGSPQGGVIISGTVTSTGLKFVSGTHIQRPGLLWLSTSQSGLANNMVYIAFSMMDGDPNTPNGWIFGYNAQNLSMSTFPLVYATTPALSAKRGGIWQGAAALAAGLDGFFSYDFLYFTTGDGTFDGTTNFGNSFIKLTPSLTRAVPPSNWGDYFTPSDQNWRQCNDLDYGSSGVLLVPDGTNPSFPRLAVHAEKENYLWVMDRGNPGGFNQGGCTQSNFCSQVTKCLPNQWANTNLQNILASSNSNQIRSTPAFWSGNTSTGIGGWLYLAGSYDDLKAYAVGTSCGSVPVCAASASSSVNLGYAATPSISSNGSSNGIVWAIRDAASADHPGLYALDAVSLNELYDSTQCSGDGIGFPILHFSVPTVANGYVYIGAGTELDIFGLIPTRSC